MIPCFLKRKCNDIINNWLCTAILHEICFFYGILAFESLYAKLQVTYSENRAELLGSYPNNKIVI